MLIDLNLLPPPKKARLRYLIKFLFTKDVLEVVLLVSSMIGLSLIWSWMVLQENFTQLTLSASMVDREFFAFHKETKRINNLIDSANIATKSYFPILPQVRQLIDSLPPDIKISSFRFDKRTSEFSLSGTAKTRDALLNYQKILGSINWIGAVQSPVSQLFQKTNINFDLQAQMKLPKPPGSEPARRATPTTDD